MARGWFGITLLFGLVAAALASGPFKTFPDQQELLSPDGRYVIRSEDPERVPSEITGTFHTLYVEECATGRRRKLYDYVRRAAAAWANSEDIIITDYVANRTARVLVFSLKDTEPVAVIDREHLARQLPSELSGHLQKNDHVYLEVLRLESQTVVLRVWGYGSLDPGGFGLNCRYDLENNQASCRVPH